MNLKTLGIWIGFDFKLHIKREGISRFLFYFIKHLLKNYALEVEVWCYSFNYKEVRELFGELLGDEFYRRRMRIITERDFGGRKVSRWEVFKSGMELAKKILLYDRGISWKQPYRYYRSYYPIDIRKRKENEGEGFRLRDYLLYLVVDIMLSVMVVLGGFVARVLRRSIIRAKPVVITRRYLEYGAKDLPYDTGREEGIERVAKEGRDREGNIVYGPYVKLSEGYYEVELEYSFEGGGSRRNPLWDIVFQRGEGVEVAVGGELEEGRGRVMKEGIYVGKEYADVPMEFRVWYKGRGELRVKRVSINREVEYDKEEEGDILAGLANKYSKANCFLIPIATLFNALEIKKPRVILLHDLVQFEFQELFLLEKKLNYSFIKDYERKLSEFAEQGCFFISNSDYVRKNHTLKFIKNVEENRTGFVYIPVNIPQDIERRILTQHETLKKYNIKDNYLFYPTQIRPYKNLITLLKALKILLDRNVNLSVVLTGNPDDSPICKHYIKEKGLDKKIILTGDVPEIDLYSLHKYALATVVPTLFEGGFPWQGLEAMLMNTPAIMSKIPVTIERLKFAGLDPENCGLKMFNPEDEVELAEKILEVLKDRDRAVIEQLPVKEKLFTYTWDDVSHLYYKIFTEEVLKE